MHIIKDGRAVNDRVFFEEYRSAGNDLAMILTCIDRCRVEGKIATGSTGESYMVPDEVLLRHLDRFDLNGAKLKLSCTDSRSAIRVQPPSTFGPYTLSQDVTIGNRFRLSNVSQAQVGRYISVYFRDDLGNDYYFQSRIVLVNGSDVYTLDFCPVAISSGWTHTVSLFTRNSVSIRGDIDGALAGTDRAVTSFTPSNPAVIGYTGLPLVNGTKYYFDDLGGLDTAVNREVFVVANVSHVGNSGTAQLVGCNGTGMTYTSGGTIEAVCDGIYSEFLTESFIQTNVRDFGGGAGVNVYYGYANRYDTELIRCGTGVVADFNLNGDTRSRGLVESEEATGFGPTMLSPVYSRFEVSTRRTGIEGTGGRGFKTAGGLYSRFEIGSIVDSYYTGLSITRGTRNCSFNGGAIIGAGSRGSTSREAIWLSDQYNRRNIISSFHIDGTAGDDIKTGVTDTNNSFVANEYSLAKVTDAGNNHWRDRFH